MRDKTSARQGLELVRRHALAVTWRIASVFHINSTDIRACIHKLR
jgi:hypothetical protein